MSLLLEKSHALLKMVMDGGASDADIYGHSGVEKSVSTRLGEVENIEQSGTMSIGVRALIRGSTGYSQAICSTSDMSQESLRDVASSALSMARHSPEDEYISLCDDTSVDDSFESSPYEESETGVLLDMAKQAEQAALDIEGVTNSDGAEVSIGGGETSLVTSRGFAASYETFGTSLSVSVIAGEGTNMQTDYDYAVARDVAGLRAARDIGASAGRGAVSKLNPQMVDTGAYPVIFSPRIARSFLRNFASAVNGESIARGSSFLQDHMGGEIFKGGVHIIDDQRRVGGLRSHPFDDEGVSASAFDIVRDGVLSSWVLDIRSAAKLGMRTTGNASRGVSSSPSPSVSNLYIKAGDTSRTQMENSFDEVIIVTDVFGMGINIITGDYSQGFAGYLVRNGEIICPVSQCTIAGNMLDMFANMTPADDLRFEYGIDSPSLLIEGMTIAGK